MTVHSLDRHIERTPGIAGGKPRIAGHRITVEDVAIWHKLGKGVEEICAEHSLGLAEVHAALAYYYDHRDEIDRSIADGDAFVANMRASTPSKVEERLRELRGE